MSAYVQPIFVGFLICIILWRILMIPATIYQYRRFGKQSPQRTLFLSIFMLYMICAYFLVILPLPDPQDVSNSYRDMMQLIPFTFIRDFFKELPWIIEGLPRTILSGPITQPIFNVILVIPFGMFLRVYFKQSLKKTVLYSFLLSLFFELTQLSGLYGIYSGPYRLFDVDDLLLNTLGGFVGYYMGPIITTLFPENVTSSDEYVPGDVTYFRRMIAYGIDIYILQFLSNFFGRYELIAFVILSFIYFTLVSKNTLGQKIVGIELRSTQGSLSRKQRFIRHLWVFGMFNVTPWLLSHTYDIMSIDQNLEIFAPFIYLFGYAGLYGFIVVHAWYMRKKTHRQLFYELSTHTEMVVNRSNQKK